MRPRVNVICQRLRIKIEMKALCGLSWVPAFAGMTREVAQIVPWRAERQLKRKMIGGI